MDWKAIYFVASLWPPVLVALVMAAAAVGEEEGWQVAGPIMVAALGLGALLAITWLRQRPIAPGDGATYRSTVFTKLAVVEGVGLLGFVLAITVGPWWLAILGAAFSLPGLALSWPSPADQERHELLYLV